MSSLPRMRETCAVTEHEKQGAASPFVAFEVTQHCNAARRTLRIMARPSGKTPKPKPPYQVLGGLNQ